MGLEALVGATIGAATNVVLKFLPDFEGRRRDADDLDDNKKTLQKEKNLLTAKRTDMLEEITKSKVTKTKKMTGECEVWLDTGQMLIDMAERLEDKFQKKSRNHFITNSIHWKAKLSRKMKNKAAEISSHSDKMNPDKAMTYEAQTSSTLSSEEIDKSPWIIRNVDNIWTLLHNKGLKKIGIYAFMGMGKTTIMRSLHDRACKNTESFEYVIFISVQDKDNEQTMQKHIMDELDINVKDISKNRYADTISRALQDKKYLLLIDQLAQEIDLEALGIRDNHYSGKVVVATRKRLVCRGLQKSSGIIKMSEDDALYMFRQIAGQVADRWQIKPYVQPIAKECGRYPLLIKAVATYLKNKGEDEEIWRECKVKLQLRRQPFLKNLHDAYQLFKFLYDELDNSRKRCLLYGALFPQNHEIYADYLMECWRAEEFIPGAGGSNDQQIFRRARGDGHDAMNHLIDGGLLERSTKAKYVRMPPLFRNWAFETGDDGPKMLVGLSNEEMKEYPAPNERGNKTRISLKCENLSKMLEGVSRQNISTLLLQRNERLDDVQLLASIFVPQSRLQVLDLGYTRITSVPSISKLKRLKALYLNDCPGLCALPTKIEELTNLEALDISRTKIPSWPAEIGNLSGLKCLRVSFKENVFNGNQPTAQGMNGVSHAFSSLKKIFIRDYTIVQPTNIISRLHQLEELTIFVDKRCPSWWNDVAEKIVNELVNLKFLTTLCFYFPTVDKLKSFIDERVSRNNNEPFRSFKIVVGCFEEENIIDLTEYKAERHLKVFAREERLEAISPILQQAHTFQLFGNQIIEHLTDLGIENMEGLKICAIQACDEMKSIIRAEDNTRGALPELERLHLFSLGKLTTVFEGHLGGKSFANLTTLTIHSCPGLSVILPLELALHVPQLEHLRVEKCYNAQAIIECDRHAREMVAALDSNLKKLELINLPNLRWIGRKIPLMCPVLQELEVDDCHRLQDFLEVVSVAMNLTWLRCSHSLWNQLSEECKRRPHLSHSATERPNPIDNLPQQEEQRGNGSNPNN